MAKPKPLIPCLVLAVTGHAGVRAEQVRQPFRRRAATLVGHRERHVDTVRYRGASDGRTIRERCFDALANRLFRNLDDALSGGDDARQFRRACR